MEKLILPALAACACSLVLSLGAIVWVLVFSPPAQLRKQVDRVRDELATALLEVLRIDSAFAALRNEHRSFVESVEAMLESVERKRKQIAGSASRLSNQLELPEPMTREEERTAIRLKVYG